MSALRPSATALLLRPGLGEVEVLLLERHREIEFHGGDWVFPGGRVDPEDLRPGDDLFGVHAARRAAARETLEETGLRVEAERLVTLSHWTTPESFPKRFATYFFAAEAPPGLAIADGVEAVSLRYLSPRGALDLHAQGEIGLPPPTWVTLHELARFETVGAALAAIAASEAPRFAPRPVEVEGGVISLYPGDAAYETLDVEAPGPRFRLVMRGRPYRFERDL